ncbi:MAG: lipid A biosynthesis acyltransferase [SAR86 cluster bacterium]|uniref:Lipid A biosynthesis acyltransferase n=1 Tax=SAR86 cluster bacterium TaxID=2030880 RepID=A0A2A4MU79_9GAMM|nr:MAG: lipid A biosynthesis acyltransferase [SAR86 cluster bacterium]
MWVITAIFELKCRAVPKFAYFQHGFCYNSALNPYLSQPIAVKTPDDQLTPLAQFAGPRYWLTWLGLFFMWTLAHFPFVLQMRIGQGLGLLSYYLARRRRHICEVNLKLCFPELNQSQLKTLLRKTFLSNGMGLMEVAMCWSRNPEDFRHRVTTSGLEHLQEAVAKGKGVLLIGAHFSTLEFGGTLFTLFNEMDITYRGHSNPLFQAVMSNARKKHFRGVIERQNVRGALKSLKDGRTLWYAPDQDYGARHSVFVPFFGVEAATITATSRFARLNDSAVLFFSHYRNEDNSGYHLAFSEVLQDYPCGDDEADAIRINQIIETAIRKHPEQYLWLHRRFKTQQAGPSARPY